MIGSVPHRAVRILQCDDSPGILDLVSEMLRPFAGLDLVEQVDRHADVIARAAVLQPDIVVLDLDAGRDDQVVARLRESCSARIIVFSGEPDLEQDPLAIQADAFVTKRLGASALVRAVLSAAEDHHDRWSSAQPKKRESPLARGGFRLHSSVA